MGYLKPFLIYNDMTKMHDFVCPFLVKYQKIFHSTNNNKNKTHTLKAGTH